jgi:hypothetical protein
VVPYLRAVRLGIHRVGTVDLVEEAKGRLMKGWHFIKGDRLRDGTKLEVGKWLKHSGKLVMCESGYHASKRLIDALQYAPGDTICRVEVRGTIIHDSDKMVASERRCLWAIDGKDVLRRSTRLCALDVIDKWDAPEIVRRYLETGDESIRADARAAAWAAGAARSAGVAAWAAAIAGGDAGWAAARAAGAAWAAGAARDKQNRRLTAMVMAEWKRKDD